MWLDVIYHLGNFHILSVSTVMSSQSGMYMSHTNARPRGDYQKPVMVSSCVYVCVSFSCIYIIYVFIVAVNTNGWFWSSSSWYMGWSVVTSSICSRGKYKTEVNLINNTHPLINYYLLIVKPLRTITIKWKR